jgi:hypothetical protein
VVVEKTCGAGKVCSWSAADGYYACVTGSTVTSDPTNTYPIACQ